MATLDELVKSGQLHAQMVPLGRNEFPDRRLYVTPEFRAWLKDTVMQAKPFYPDSMSPRQQAFDLLKSFIIGRDFHSNKMFKRMSPQSDDVYELRSDDLRFFGWFPKKDCFVAVVGDEFAALKEDKTLYEVHRLECIAFRNKLDLNEPKYIPGAKEHDVISN